MKADKLNTWLTLGANIGVVVRLFLLLLEINQNTEMMRAQITQARADSLLERYRDEIHSDYWAEIRAKRRAADSPKEWAESLTPTEYERVWIFQLFQWHNLRTQFYQYQAGFLDQRIWEQSSKAEARRFMETWPYFNFASGGMADVDPEFLDFMDGVARESGLPTLSEGSKSGLVRPNRDVRP